MKKGYCDLKNRLIYFCCLQHLIVTLTPPFTMVTEVTVLTMALSDGILENSLDGIDKITDKTLPT